MTVNYINLILIEFEIKFIIVISKLIYRKQNNSEIFQYSYFITLKQVIKISLI